MMKTYNSNHVSQENGSVVATFSQGWINYLDENNQWQTIDTTLADMGDYFEMTKAPFTFRAPKLSTGTAEFISTNRWDIFQNQKINHAPITMKIRALEVDEVSGQLETGDLGFGQSEYVVYKSAYPTINADLIYFIHHGKVPRLRKIVRFNSMPLLDQSLKFEISFNEKIYIKSNQKTWDGKSKLNCQSKLSFRRTNDSSARGIGFYDFYLWDEWSKRKQIASEMNCVGANTYELTKKIPLLDFAGLNFPCYTDASTTFNPNANPESTSVDGYAAWSGAGSTWATVRAAAGTSSDDTDIFDMRITSSTTLNLVIRNTRCPVLFDTSSITSSNFVTAATFGFTGTSPVAEQALSLTVVSTTPTSNTALAASDYNIAKYGTTHLTNDVTQASITDDVEKILTLNSSGLSQINISGITKFALVWVEDIDNTFVWSSNTDNRFVVYSAEYTTKPNLTVTYFPIAPLRLPLMGVG